MRKLVETDYGETLAIADAREILRTAVLRRALGAEHLPSNQTRQSALVYRHNKSGISSNWWYEPNYSSSDTAALGVPVALREGDIPLYEAILACLPDDKEVLAVLLQHALISCNAAQELEEACFNSFPIRSVVFAWQRGATLDSLIAVWHTLLSLVNARHRLFASPHG